MSFTQDELQSLNAIFDQKMAILRRDLERSLDQRMQSLRRDFEHRQTTILQDLLRGLTRRINEQQHRSRDALHQRLDTLHQATTETIQRELAQASQHQGQQLEDSVERALAAQLLAIEQLITQRLPIPAPERATTLAEEAPPEFDAIEVQTEIPWEDLVELIDKVLVERLEQINVALQTRLQDMERAFVVQLHILRDQLQRGSGSLMTGDEQMPAVPTSMQEVFSGIDQLEHLVESMQVAMTANIALLSNRIYHHQHLPPDRAHPRQQSTATVEPTTQTQNNDEATPLSFPRIHEGEHFPS